MRVESFGRKGVPLRSASSTLAAAASFECRPPEVVRKRPLPGEPALPAAAGRADCGRLRPAAAAAAAASGAGYPLSSAGVRRGEGGRRPAGAPELHGPELGGARRLSWTSLPAPPLPAHCAGDEVAQPDGLGGLFAQDVAP